MSSPSVLAAMTTQVLAAAESLGAEVPAIVHEAGIDPALLTDPDARVPLEQHLKMWEILSRRGDGLHIGARIGIAALGVIGYAMQHEATVGDALAWQQRVGAVLYPGLVPQLERRCDAAGDYVVFVRAMVPAFARLREPIFAQAASIVAMMRALAGVTARPAFVALPLSRPADPREVEAYFACPVAWDAPLLQIGFDAGLLAVPLPRADPQLFGYLARRAESMLLEGMPADASWADRVRREIGAALTEGEPRLQAVAKRLAVSERTLHRRLLDEQTNFTGLVEEARHARALQLLADRSLSASEVAVLLGYAEPAPFFRAFKRWTGETPQGWRRRETA
ncbi:AraC family transcriptional regulator ligand-binding domain-containing protein [Nannocystis sp. ILAH1]|uniref:AraC family transcriptional regulator n=1 Tax=unclassified Nannocystis TaxID=2627009 RepID=UPI00226DA249|nr:MULTISPECIES: AraC family transcriptional regulator [unclassified Nannocystis]MCY0988616.1 AraC family transcriptional regulator ligand-binding domain-containing protein [Nannocystis sp. ILAH1]MCY1067420.1 AraC family transcriptional regulator ligand-binding domain-containing protein [Nannocystis sp. RBIL2]